MPLPIEPPSRRCASLSAIFSSCHCRGEEEEEAKASQSTKQVQFIIGRENVSFTPMPCLPVHCLFCLPCLSPFREGVEKGERVYVERRCLAAAAAEFQN